MTKRSESNFKKAVNELLGPGTKETKEVREPFEPQSTVQETMEEERQFVSFDMSQAKELPVAPPRLEQALIPSDMVITGNITTKSNMKILGNIVGDVDCEGDIELYGSIQGNVSVGNLTIQSGGLKGDAIVRENIVIEEEVSVVGNLTATNVISNAKTEGRIQAAGIVELRENALAHGDINAGGLSVSAGAKIKGMVNISE